MTTSTTPTRSYYHVALVLLLVVLQCWTHMGYASEGSDTDPLGMQDITVDSIFSAWGQFDDTFPDVQLTWSHNLKSKASRFSRFQSEWISDTEVESGQGVPSLAMSQVQFVYKTVRWPMTEHGWKEIHLHNVRPEIQKRFPERINLYQASHASYFSNRAAEFRDPQSFRCEYRRDGAYVDFWHSSREHYPKATIHVLPEYGSVDWAQCRFDERSSDQLDTLDMSCALFALRPSHPLFNIRKQNCKLVSKEVFVDGHQCAKLVETPKEDSGISRTWLVNVRFPHVIRRFIGQTASEGVQADVEWRAHESGSPTPTRWTALIYGSADEPLQYFITSDVTNIEYQSANFSLALSVDSFPAGTWVVDQHSGDQYLVNDQGDNRLLTQSEFEWLPTYEELRNSNAGEVGAFIKLSERSLFHTITITALILAVGGLCFFAAHRQVNSRRAIARSEI